MEARYEKEYETIVEIEKPEGSDLYYIYIEGDVDSYTETGFATYGDAEDYCNEFGLTTI